MKRLLLNLYALILVTLSYIFNSGLLSLVILFIYSIQHFVLHYSQANYSINLFILSGAGLILLFVIIGILDVPILTRIITNSRLPLKSENEKIIRLSNEIDVIINQTYSKKLNVFIADNFLPNASSYGKNTIIIEKTLLKNYNDDEIKAVLLHEVSHLINKDSFIVLVVFWVNLPLQIILWFYQMYASLFVKVMQNIKSIFNLILLIPLVIFLPLIILTLLGKIILNLTLKVIRRMFEYEADKFVANYGYSKALISFLEKQLILEQSKGIIDKIMDDYPGLIKRIARLEKY